MAAMAAAAARARWLLQRRLTSVLDRYRQSTIPLPPGYSRSSYFSKGIKTEASTIVNSNDEDDSKQVSNPLKILNTTGEESSVTYRAFSNLKASARHDLAMIFTCKVCETRSVKTVCRESYEKGVVVARCSGCNNLHLIADRLGWFGEPGSVEDFLATRGEEVKKGSIDTLNLTLEELAGAKLSGS
ncbi:hypothetical protein Cni_G08743 [Canna indica]|uniref:DNL-type domain-containing protein n=1 Tax=Canna indica TaxID=4628 RepID=A0AAQ3Q8Z4_9LILI|nr:hypothetical protein Cni_G08743 [Canna indica]